MIKQEKIKKKQHRKRNRKSEIEEKKYILVRIKL